MLLVEVHDDFRVGPGAERMPAGAQLIAKLHVIVNLAVERDPDRPILVGQRLAAALQVDDGEPAGHHPERAVRVEPALIRAPVEHGLRHPVQQRLVDGGAVETILARDSAHTPRASAPASRAP